MKGKAQIGRCCVHPRSKLEKARDESKKLGTEDRSNRINQQNLSAFEKIFDFSLQSSSFRLMIWEDYSMVEDRQDQLRELEAKISKIREYL